MEDYVSNRHSRNYVRIPEDTDVLITHSPAYGILDFDNNINYSSEELLQAVSKINPHIHFWTYSQTARYNLHREYDIFKRSDNERRLLEKLT